MQERQLLLSILSACVSSKNIIVISLIFHSNQQFKKISA